MSAPASTDFSGQIYLAVAIAAEVIATSCLKAADGFTRLPASLVVIIGYGVAFVCMSIAVRSIPVGLSYAIWSGIGTVAVSVIGWVFYRQALDAAAMAGIGLILAGVLVIRLLSNTVGG